jgi:hypothetical protein
MNKHLLLISLLFCFYLPAMENTIPAVLKTVQIAGGKRAFYTRDGNYLVMEAYNGVGNTMMVKKTPQYEEGTSIPLPPRTSIADVSPENKAITTDTVNPLMLWDIHNGAHWKLSEETQEAACAKYNKTGNLLAFNNRKGISIMDVKSSKILKVLENSVLTEFNWNPTKESEIGICAMQGGSWNDTKWRVWDFVTGNDAQDLATIKNLPITSYPKYSNDACSLVAGADSQFVQYDFKTAVLAYYNLKKEKSATPFPATGSPLYSASLVPGAGTRVFAGTVANQVVYADLDEPQNSFIFNPEPGHIADPVFALAIHPSLGHMAVSNLDAKDNSVVKILDIRAHIKAQASWSNCYMQ